MKAVHLLIVAALLLGGCPDAKVPKTPPRVPEPKAQTLHADVTVNSRQADRALTPGLIAAAL
ncbi:MAG: hypothetical protein M3R45_14250 [Pseudomonadota bacterium]|nr:hypothetical protein [Pseudomonadota bacterium]